MTERDRTGGYWVTSEMMYKKLSEIDAKVTTLVERDRTDHERLKELERASKWLQRAVYAIGVPLVVILGGYEAITKLML